MKPFLKTVFIGLFFCSCSNPAVKVKEVKLSEAKKQSEPLPPPPPSPPSVIRTQDTYKKISISEWLQIICSDRPDSSIQFFNFTITELETGKKYGLYLVGSKTFDPSNDDGAFVEDYTSRIGVVLPQKIYENLGIEEIENKIAVQLKLEIGNEKYKNCFLVHSKILATGFKSAGFTRLK